MGGGGDAETGGVGDAEARCDAPVAFQPLIETAIAIRWTTLAKYSRRCGNRTILN